MKLHWITSTSLSLVRAVQSSGRKSLLGLCGASENPFSLKDRDATERFAREAQSVSERLVTASVSETLFWDHLLDELISSGSDASLTPQICEVALLRAGHSQLQSDQTAAAIDRSLDHCRRLMNADAPRWAEQLRLRYAPLKQSYEAYGPGMLRSIGNQIWSGTPPKDWWPKRVTVHAVQPLRGGAAGRSGFQSSVWIEAVLTDISPQVPEWLRLTYQLTLLAIDTQTRTHASGGLSGSSTSGAGGGKYSSKGKSPSELPWSLGIIPLILHQAGAAGVLPAERLPISEALELWWLPEENASSHWLRNLMRDVPGSGASSILAETLANWWRESGSQAAAFPIALKELNANLTSSVARRETDR